MEAARGWGGGGGGGEQHRARAAAVCCSNWAAACTKYRCQDRERNFDRNAQFSMRKTSVYLRQNVTHFEAREDAPAYLGSVFEPSCRMPEATATMRTRVGLMLPAVMLTYSDGMCAYLKQRALRTTKPHGTRRQTTHKQRRSEGRRRSGSTTDA